MDTGVFNVISLGFKLKSGLFLGMAPLRDDCPCFSSSSSVCGELPLNEDSEPFWDGYSTVSSNSLRSTLEEILEESFDDLSGLFSSIVASPTMLMLGFSTKFSNVSLSIFPLLSGQCCPFVHYDLLDPCHLYCLCHFDGVEYFLCQD